MLLLKHRTQIMQHNETTVRGNISDSFVKLKNPDQSVSWSEKTDVVLIVSTKETSYAEKNPTDGCTVLDIHLIEFIFSLQ